MFFRYVGGVWRGFQVTPDQKMMKKFFFWKKCFIRSEKARGPAGDRGKKFEKIRKIFGSTNYRPGRTGPAPARPRFRNFPFWPGTESLAIPCPGGARCCSVGIS